MNTKGRINENTILVDASYRVEDLKNYFDLKINLNEEDEIESVGGLLFFIANKVPKNNQVYIFKDILQFKVIKASARRIELLQIKKLI